MKKVRLANGLRPPSDWSKQGNGRSNKGKKKQKVLDEIFKALTSKGSTAASVLTTVRGATVTMHYGGDQTRRLKCGSNVLAHGLAADLVKSGKIGALTRKVMLKHGFPPGQSIPK